MSIASSTLAGVVRSNIAEAAVAAPANAALSDAALAPPFAAYVLGRLGFGPRRGSGFSIERFNALGSNDLARLEAFVDEQLSPTRDAGGNITDPDVDTKLTGAAWSTLRKSFDALWREHEVNGQPPDGPNIRDYPIREGERLVFVRAMYSRWQLAEVMAGFWHDHFNVYGYGRYANSTWTSWDRDVIRKHAFGNFRAMLEASFEAPAMQYFLDNYVNQAPSFNENYAREILELHTLGAINYLGPELQQHEVPTIPPGEHGAGLPVGYVDADVYELARAFTGWTIGNGAAGTANDGRIAFINGRHDIGQKHVLGSFVAANTPAMSERATLLDAIAHHPGTARYIALKLARRFIADEPPQEAIEHAADVFYRARTQHDQIAQTLRALLLFNGVAGAFPDARNFGNKVRRPFEAVVSALRAVDADFVLRRDDTVGNAFMDRFRRSGHRPFDWRAPDGYPDHSNYWMSSMAFVHAWRTLDWVLDEGTGNGQTPLAPILATTLARLGANPANHTPDKLAAFWLERCFGWKPDPTTGWLGTELHATVRDFLCRGPDTLSMFPANRGIGSGPAGNLLGIETNTGPNWWYTRLRGMVNVILFSPQFMLR